MAEPELGTVPDDQVSDRGGVAMLAIDYSDDELDAIAELFHRRDLGSTGVRSPPEDPVERALLRAVSDAAIRALVARRAIALSGSESFPRVRFLDPHATILGTFVGADAVASVKVEQRGRVRTRALFASGEILVEQQPLRNLAIKRMVARPRGEAETVLLRDLPFSGADGPPGRMGLEVTLGQLAATDSALAGGEDPPPGLASGLLDILYARTASGTVIVRRRVRGIVVAERVSWLAAGSLGTWRIEPAGTQPSVTARLEPTTDEAVRDAVLAAWSSI